MAINRRRMDLGPVTLNYPIIKLRILLPFLAILTLLYFFGGIIFLLPLMFLGGMWGSTLGTIATIGLFLVVGGLVTFHSYRKNLASHLQHSTLIEEPDDPVLEESLDFIESEAADRDMPTPKFHVSRADVSNALAIGRKGNSHIIVTQQLIEQLSMEELKAVLGHEIAHIENRHTAFMTVMIGIKFIIWKFWTWVGLMMLHYRYRNAVLSPREEEILEERARNKAWQLLKPIGFFENSMSRHREYIADAEAAAATSADAMKSALRTLDDSDHEIDNTVFSQSLLIFGSHDGFLTSLRSTHPSYDRRVKKLDKLYSD